MYVCLCFAVKEKEITRLVEEGALSINDIHTQCQAGKNCGSCLDQIQQIIDQKPGKNPLEAPAIKKTPQHGP